MTEKYSHPRMRKGKGSVATSFLVEVRDYLVKHALLPETGTVIVAFSGGPDSLALLDALHRLTGPGNLYASTRLHAAHLHHGLRGAAADEDARFVAATCATMNIPCTVERLDGQALQHSGQSLEAALRTARYAFLRRVAATVGAACIALGHTADDQVETLVMHWLRGSGLAGAVGMRPRDRDLIRPLLGVSHAATRAYCAERGLQPREDASNTDPRFLRNRIRHELLPVLRRYNPRLDTTLLRSAAVFAEDYAFIEEATAAHWAQVVRRETADELLLDIDAYLALPTALRRHLLRRATAQLAGGNSPLELRHHELIDALAHTSGAGRRLTLPGGLWMQRGYGMLVLSARAAELTEPKPTATPLVPGTIQPIPGTPWCIRTELLPADAPAAQPRQRSSPGALDAPEPVALLDHDALGAGLSVRTRRPGDRFQPLGLTSAKKLQDFMVDARIPRRLRDTIPLVIAGDEIVWVAGYRISERARLTATTRRVLRLELLPLKTADRGEE